MDSVRFGCNSCICSVRMDLHCCQLLWRCDDASDQLAVSERRSCECAFCSAYRNRRQLCAAVTNTLEWTHTRNNVHGLPTPSSHHYAANLPAVWRRARDQRTDCSEFSLVHTCSGMPHCWWFRDAGSRCHLGVRPPIPREVEGRAALRNHAAPFQPTARKHTRSHSIQN